MPNIEIVLCDTLPSQEDLNGVLGKYYATIVERMGQMGFEIDPAAPQSALAEFWANADGYLPPQGCLVLARKKTGEVVGCGMMKRLSPDTGELKRVFVIPEARGTGTGRALIMTRIKVAREMGLSTLVADTLTPNIEMRSLYLKLGFVEVSGPIETTTYLDQPMLRPHLHYFTMDLTAS